MYQTEKSPVNSKGNVQSRVNKLLEDPKMTKVLDVSKLTNTGTGASTIKRPSTSRSTKFMGDKLPIVSADIEHYLLALDMLDGGQEAYINEIAAFEKNSKSSALSQEYVPIAPVKQFNIPITKVSPTFKGGVPKYKEGMDFIIPSSPFPSGNEEFSIANLLIDEWDTDEDESDEDFDDE